MTEGSQRQDFRELAERSGWQRRDMDRIDIYRKGIRTVDAHWTGKEFSGGTLYHDYHMEAHTRDSATAQSWLTKW